MSQTVTLEINGRDVEVGAEFLNLSREQQERTVEEIASSLTPRQSFMGNVNQGIASSVGGLVDFINPFDKPHALNPFPEGTGSAVRGIERGMDAMGIQRAQGAPDSVVNAFGRGMGDGAGMAIPAGATARALKGAGGALGQIADDASLAMNSGRGAVSEALAGGGAGAASKVAKDEGAGGLGQFAAGMLGGGAVAAAPWLAARGPMTTMARKGYNAVKRAALPYTTTGGRQVAAQRLRELAGGEARANELARSIPEDGGVLGLTPAQSTGDQNLLAMEQEAARVDPALRERLANRAQTSQQRAMTATREMGGDAADAQSFFEQRKQEARDTIQGFITRARQADEAARPQPKRSGPENSEIVAGELRSAEAAALETEKRLWDAVPKGVQVGTSNARSAAQRIVETTPQPNQRHIPSELIEFLTSGNRAFGDFETVANMHGLYSELRQTARDAMARANPDKRQAAMANEVADAILDDLGAGAGTSEVGRTIDTARAFSAEMHETFGAGTVGQLLKRSLAGGDKMDPQLTLDRAIGSGGARGKVGQEDIYRASDTEATEGAVEDYLRGRFANTAFPGGTFKPGPAQTFMGNHEGNLLGSPYLRQSFEDSMAKARRAQSVADRGGAVLSGIDNPNRSARAAFEQAPTDQAASAIFRSKRPVAAARELVRTARKDKSGLALEGVKGSLLDHVTKSASRFSDGLPTLSGNSLTSFLSDPTQRAALGQAFKPEELRRLDVIASELLKLEKAQKTMPAVELSNATPNRVIEMLARVVAANHGAALGRGGASIQTANMASARVKSWLGNLQNDKATELLIRAVEDPVLFRGLLMETEALRLNKKVRARLAPYFTGTTAGASSDTD